MALGFYQVLIALGQTFNLGPVPHDFSDVFDYFQFIGVDWASFAYPVGCLDGYENTLLLVTAFSPLAVIACVLLTVWAAECRVKGRKKPSVAERLSSTTEFPKYSSATEASDTEAPGSHAAPSPVRRKSEPNPITHEPTSTATTSTQPQQGALTAPPSAEKRVTAVYVSLLIIYICMTSVSRAIFSTWVCELYEISGPGNTTSFLLKDPSVECHSHKHYESKAVAIAMLLLWPVRNRHRLLIRDLLYVWLCSTPHIAAYR